MHLTIYFQYKPLFICNSITPDLEDYLHQKDVLFMDESNPHSVRTMIHELNTEEFRAGVLLTTDINATVHLFKKNLVPIQAAGGLVYTDDQKVLFIFRKGKWDLPKGKLDEGETLEECAVREVEEETGIEGIELGQFLCTTYHTYHQDGLHILKESHWYAMRSKVQELVPQTEEDIEKCEWVPFDNLEPYVSHSHYSIQEVVKQAGAIFERRSTI